MNFNSETGFRLLSLRYVLERERKNSRKMKELRNADRISSGDCVSVVCERMSDDVCNREITKNSRVLKALNHFNFSFVAL